MTLLKKYAFAEELMRNAITIEQIKKVFELSELTIEYDNTAEIYYAEQTEDPKQLHFACMQFLKNAINNELNEITL